MVSWNGASTAGVSVENPQASMGPRRWCRGMAGPRRIGHARRPALMGPRRWCWGMDDGLAQAVVTPAVPCKLLQWGHDDGVVEWDKSVNGTGSVAALQWAHDDGVLE